MTFATMQFILEFIIQAIYLTDDEGNYLTDDEGNRLIEG